MKKLGWIVCFILFAGIIEFIFELLGWHLFGFSQLLSFIITSWVFYDEDERGNYPLGGFDLEKGKPIIEIRNEVYQKEYKGVLLECVDKECNRYGNSNIAPLIYWTKEEYLRFDIKDEDVLLHLIKYNKDFSYKFDNDMINVQLANDINKKVMENSFDFYRIPSNFKNKIFIHYFKLEKYSGLNHFTGKIKIKYIP